MEQGGSTERSIRAGLGDVPINGKLDKIEFNGKLQTS